MLKSEFLLTPNHTEHANGRFHDSYLQLKPLYLASTYFPSQATRFRSSTLRPSQRLS